MFNQVLFAQLPSIVSSEDNFELLSAFHAMIDARKDIVFLKVLEKVAAKIAPIMEKLCPRLMEYQHRYDFYTSFQSSQANL
jgi:hypothetical protein